MSCAGPIIVSGFGRCGSSLVMQMLHAGGIRCTGDYPAFENAAAIAAPGVATKILDPHRNPLPPGASIIWLDRDRAEQAKSHAKFNRLLLGLIAGREERRRIEASFSRDRHRAMAAFSGRPMLRLQFEEVLRDPAAAAAQLAAFLGRAFDQGAAAKQVLPRGPACAPDLAIELLLMGRAEATP